MMSSAYLVTWSRTSGGPWQYPGSLTGRLHSHKVIYMGTRETRDSKYRRCIHTPNSLIISHGPSPMPTITMERGYLEAWTMADRVGRSLVTWRERERS